MGLDHFEDRMAWLEDAAVTYMILMEADEAMLPGFINWMRGKQLYNNSPLSEVQHTDRKHYPSEWEGYSGV